jgi:hypothetical protein
MLELSVLADYGDLGGEAPLWDRRSNTADGERRQ